MTQLKLRETGNERNFSEMKPGLIMDSISTCTPFVRNSKGTLLEVDNLQRYSTPRYTHM